MSKRTVNYTVRLSEDERRWLTILREKYRIRTADFVRDAIVEKLRKDVPAIREKAKREWTPF